MNMKLSSKKKRAAIVASTLFAVTAVPSFAIFGLGDIVFDPTAYAEMLIQKSQQVEELAKLESQLETMYKTYETLQKSYDTSVNTYNSIHASAQRFNLKTMWKPFLLAAQAQVNVDSQNGETDGFTDALNKVSAVAGKLAWKQGGVAVQPSVQDYLKAEQAGNPVGHRDHRATQPCEVDRVQAQRGEFARFHPKRTAGVSFG